MKKLYLFVDPNQTPGSFGNQVRLEVDKWTERGWAVRILLPENIRKGTKFPASGWILQDGQPVKVQREQLNGICSATPR